MNRQFIVGLALALLTLVLPGCSRSSPPTWQVTATGLHGTDVYWCDSTHVAAKSFDDGTPGRRGVQFLDTKRPNEPVQVGLPGQTDLQPWLLLLGCDSNNVMVVRARSIARPKEHDTWALPWKGVLTLLATTKPMGSSDLHEKLVDLPSLRRMGEPFCLITIIPGSWRNNNKER